MGSIPRSNTLPTTRRTIRGSRQHCRLELGKLLVSGNVLTYTEPVSDPGRGLGMWQATAVLMAPETPHTDVTPWRPPGTDVVHVITTARPPARPPARTAPFRHVRTGYRRVRAVRRETVTRVCGVTGWTIAAGVVVFCVYELVMFVIAVVTWIAAHGAELLGVAVVILLVLALGAGKAVCHVCGR